MSPLAVVSECSTASHTIKPVYALPPLGQLPPLCWAKSWQTSAGSGQMRLGQVDCRVMSKSNHLVWSLYRLHFEQIQTNAITHTLFIWFECLVPIVVVVDTNTVYRGRKGIYLNCTSTPLAKHTLSKNGADGTRILHSFPSFSPITN